MIAALMGSVSKVDEFQDKKTGVPVRTAYVATGEHMIPVRLENGEEFDEMDVVVVCGELKSFERRFYVNGGQIRLATPDDKVFFGRAKKQALMSMEMAIESQEVQAGKKSDKIGQAA